MKTGNGLGHDSQHVSFILLAEFDIDQGSILSHQYPYPTGMDEQLIAELMIPDGVHDQSEDWTIFFMNQTPGNTITEIFTPSGEEEEVHEERKDLLHGLNLVRTKHDKSVRRGAIVKALAIVTHHPFIQIFKPVLLIALEEYYADPSVECLARLFDAVNSMDLSMAPALSRDEKLILRVSERKDVFAEKFVNVMPPPDPRTGLGKGHRKTSSEDSSSQFSVGGGTRKLSLTGNAASTSGHGHERKLSVVRDRSRSPSLSLQSVSEGEDKKSHRSSVTGGSAIWVGDHGEDAAPLSGRTTTPGVDLSRRKMSMDQISIASSFSQRRDFTDPTGSKSSLDHQPSHANPHRLSVHPHHHRHGGVRDTHFFETHVSYNGHNLPIRVPLSTFPEEVGDSSLIQLIQTFTSPTATVTGPAHPHLHTSGVLTPPLILLFNALITQKRIIFMGYGRPAGHVSAYVLAAVAFASGCGCYLRGFAERAFPYTNLSNKAVMEAVPGFIAGVTNPIYESLPIWDVLCNIETGKIIVNKDISNVAPPISSFPQPPSGLGRPGTSSGPDGDDSRASVQMMAGSGMVGGGALNASGGGKAEGGKAAGDNHDASFIEELTTAVQQHYGESVIRARVAEYVLRFIRIAAAYEEIVLQKNTTIGFSMQPFSETGVSTAMVGLGIPQGFGGSLGSGMVFADEGVGRSRELSANAARIEGWRLTKSYEYWQQDFQLWLEARSIKGMDVLHQISRLRYAKSIGDGEMDLIMRSLYYGVRTYEQIVELLSHLPPHAGGLLPLSFALFHTSPSIRETTVDVINIIRSQPIGNQFVNALNAFHRFAYIQILETRKQQQAAQARQQEIIASQQHQQAQIAQQLYAAATSTSQEQLPAPTTKASRRETATNLVNAIFNGNGTLSRSGSVHRNINGGVNPTTGATAF